MFETVINIYETLLCTFFLYSLSVTHKEHSIIKACVFVLVQFTFISIVNIYSPSEQYLDVIEMLFSWIYLNSISYDSKIKNLMFAILVEFSIALMNMIIVYSLSFLLYRQIDFFPLMEEWRIPVVIFVQAVHTLVFWLIARAFRKTDLHLTNREYLLAAGLLVIGNALCESVDGIMFDADHLSIYMIIALYLIILLNIVVFLLFTSISKHTLQVEKQTLKLQELEQQGNSLEKLLAVQKEMFSLRHDMKHLVTYLKKDTVNKEIAETIRKYENFNDELVPIVTLVPAFNNVINIKREEAIQKGISFVSIVNITKDPNIEESDAYLLLSNLLDNAIQHIGMEKNIRLTMNTQANFLRVSVVNSVDRQVLDEDGNMIRFNDKKSHGYGIGTIKEIVKKYDGIFEFRQIGFDLEAQFVIEIRD